jgi:hypothetical protein
MWVLVIQLGRESDDMVHREVVIILLILVMVVITFTRTPWSQLVILFLIRLNITMPKVLGV